MDSQTVDTNSKGNSTSNNLPFINQLKKNYKMAMLIAGVVLIAITSIAYLWLKDESYGVLFSNLNDKDGGEIISQLEKMNIPYKFSSSGSTILIPENKVYDTRLRIAQQGLPKGGAVGFELLDKDNFGMSQFNEQINYQRALEGELSRTIAIISSVEDARVHLAMPKPSFFVRERKFPSASVALTLLPGRALSQGQIDGIVHLISSSVPELQADKVTIIDQRGNLLTGENFRDRNANVAQLEYSERIESSIRERVEKIIMPIIGKNNVIVQVNAEVDFSRQETTSEIYDPNSDEANQTIRSKQLIDNRQLANSENTGGIGGGVPGALSNQPVPTPSAPIDGESTSTTEEEEKEKIYNLQSNNTLNYEVNKQVVHSQIPEGRIKRLSVAVLVNYKFVAAGSDVSDVQDENNNENDESDENAVTATDRWIKLNQDELSNIEALARQAMGFSNLRGDTITVANLKFTDQISEEDEIPSFWQKPEFYDLIKSVIKYLIIVLVLWLVWRKVLKSMWIKLQPQLLTSFDKSADKSIDTATDKSTDTATTTTTTAESQSELDDQFDYFDYKAHSMQLQRIFEDNMQQQEYIREIVDKEPRVMALIIRGWMDKEGSNQ